MSNYRPLIQPGILTMQKIVGFIIWLIVTLFVIYQFTLTTTAAVFATSIKDSLHVNDIGVSITAGAFILGYACMQIPAGYLLDKFNARFVVSAGILILTLGSLLTSYSTNLTLYALSNLIEGIGASFSFIAAAVLTAQWFSTKTFPILFGLTQTLSCLFAGILHYYFTLELDTHSWNDIYQTLALFGIILFGVALLIVKTPAGFQRENTVSIKSSLISVLSNKQILLCCFAGATSFGILLAYASLWYMPIESYYSVKNLQAVMISGIIFAGIGIGTPILGFLSNRAHSRVKIVHITLTLGIMVLLLGIYYPHNTTVTLLPIQIISFLIGFLLSGSMLFYTMVSEIATDANRGVAIGTLNTAVFLVNTLMLFIPYLFITETAKEFFTYLWILPFILLTSLLTLHFIRDTYRG